MSDSNISSDDTRNVTDEFKGMSVDAIKDVLDERRIGLQIAVENLERDFNMGTIVRTANAFNVSVIHVVGRRQWNKRGAMVTDKYMNIEYHPDILHFADAMKERTIIGVDNIDDSQPLGQIELPNDAVLVFGSEGQGLSQAMIKECKQLVAIEQFGSTRSINVGVAAGVVMYEWLRQHVL